MSYLLTDICINRLFPYSIAVGALTVLFLGIILFLVAQRQLLTGLVERSIQLYGPRGSVNSYCNAYRRSTGFEQGQGEATLAWLETQGICNDWKAAFAFYIVGTVFLLWMMVMAWQVQRDEYD